MITKITPTKVHQKCDICGADRKVDIADLVAGVGSDPNIIRMPDCTCGAVEHLGRSWDHDPGAHEWANTRRRVNRLHAMLVSGGRAHAAHSARFVEEATTARVPPDMDPEPIDEEMASTRK